MSVNSFFREFVRSHLLTGLVILIVLFLLVIWVTRQSPGKPQLYLVQAGIVTTIVALMALVIAPNSFIGCYLGGRRAAIGCARLSGDGRTPDGAVAHNQIQKQGS